MEPNKEALSARLKEDNCYNFWGSELGKEDALSLIDLLTWNHNLFAWTTTNMPNIHHNVKSQVIDLSRHEANSEEERVRRTKKYNH